jgi:hypothetical protein
MKYRFQIILSDYSKGRSCFDKLSTNGWVYRCEYCPARPESVEG